MFYKNKFKKNNLNISKEKDTYCIKGQYRRLSEDYKKLNNYNFCKIWEVDSKIQYPYNRGLSTIACCYTHNKQTYLLIDFIGDLNLKNQNNWLFKIKRYDSSQRTPTGYEKIMTVSEFRNWIEKYLDEKIWIILIWELLMAYEEFVNNSFI